MDVKPYFKVIIAGGRDFNNYELLKTKCDYYLVNIAKTHQIIIVSGAAKGADKLGERYAKERNYLVEAHAADWDKHGKRAGMLRNAEMSKCANACICFWDKISKGTNNMIENAKKDKLLLKVVYY